MLKLLKKYYPELFLLGIVGFIFARNYVPGTYLIGWDSLQTEFYPWLAVKRSLFSVWEEYQSFGLPTGMAHAADLVRALFLYFLSFVINKSLLRYIFHHLVLLLGGIGAYNLFNYLGFKSKKSPFVLLGATFYILNLGTAQMFGLPFEPFSVFFAFLPWEILFFINYIEDKSRSKKSLLLFILTNILATPQAYQQSQFLVYVLVISLIALGIVIKRVVSGSKKEVPIYIKNTFSALLVIFIINSFWILPQIYSLRSSVDLAKQAKINQLATDTLINRNVEKGKVQYLARFENFYYDLRDTDGNYLFSSWKSYFNNKYAFILSYVPFVFIIIGLVFGKKKYATSLISVFVLISFIFLSGTIPLSIAGEYLRKASMLGQIFRSPFTKFVFPYVLICAYFFALGLEAVYSKSLGLLFKGRLSDLSIILYFISTFALILFINIPALKGNLFLPQMKIKVPDQYIQLMEYFKGEDKNSRIALLPDYTFWGWFQNNWGYDGSGFLWYGIEQPVISRTFDVWSKESESYFWEIKRAIESQNSEDFKKILDKYDVDYLVIDYSLNPVTSVESGLQYDQISEIIRNSTDIALVKSFQNIDVFKISHSFEINKFFSIVLDLPNVGPGYDLTDYDNAYVDLGNYYTDSKSKYDVIYPFIDLMTQTDRFNKQWEISEKGDSFIVSANIEGVNLGDYIIVENNIPLKAKIFDGENIIYYDLTSNISIQDEKLTVSIKKVLVESILVENMSLVNCRNSLMDFGKVDTLDNILQIYAKNRSAACFSYNRPFLAHWNSYLVKVDSENISGEPLFFYIVGSKSNTQSKIENNLPSGLRYFILGSGNYFDDGYTFGFQNISYVGEISENKLKGLEVYLFPFDYLKNIKLVNKSTKIASSRFSTLSDLKKINYFTYYLKQGDIFHNSLVLYQAFDRGWLAVCNLKVCDARHVKINGWANGWLFKETVPSEVLIIYWPQLLQFLGFFLLLILLVLVGFCKRKSRASVVNAVEPTKEHTHLGSHSVDKE
ncbi:MAG: hypothetical protein WAX66_01895 [Patescibacteria group bacterium]